MKTYNIDIDGKKYTRNADDAHAAICRICDQYGWRKGSYCVDAQTRGDLCCEMHTSHGFAVAVAK